MGTETWLSNTVSGDLEDARSQGFIKMVIYKRCGVCGLGVKGGPVYCGKVCEMTYTKPKKKRRRAEAWQGMSKMTVTRWAKANGEDLGVVNHLLTILESSVTIKK